MKDNYIGNYINKLLQSEKIKIEKDNERLELMIKSCDQMINTYLGKINKNDKQIKQINDILKGKPY